MSPDHGQRGDMTDAEYIAALNRELMVANAKRDRYEDALVRAARLCEGRDTAMVLQVIREALA